VDRGAVPTPYRNHATPLPQPTGTGYAVQVRNWLLLPVLILALAGCGRGEKVADTSIDSRIPPALAPRFFPPQGWAWGTVTAPGDPAVRYGVAAPTGVPRASVIIAANANESAEVYFETARNLIAQGYTVWVLDPAPSPTSQAAAIHALLDNTVRPRAGDTVVLAGYDSGGLAALLEAEAARPRIDALLLWAPKLSEPRGAQAAAKVRAGDGDDPADGERDWARPDYDLSGRATLAQAWRTANPDLRPAKRPWIWFAGEASAAEIATSGQRLKAVSVPVLIMAAPADTRATNVCSTLPHCERQGAAMAPLPPHLAPDAARDPWLKAVTAFIDAQVTAHAADRAHGL
jgi:lysophospholipase